MHVCVRDFVHMRVGGGDDHGDGYVWVFFNFVGFLGVIGGNVYVYVMCVCVWVGVCVSLCVFDVVWCM